MPGRIIIAGGTGFIGQHLAKKLLADHYEVVILSRSQSRQSPAPPYQLVQWDARTVGSWAGIMEGALAIVNLAGESIGSKRWSAVQKAKIIDSRIGPTSAIVEGLKQVERKPRILVNASAVGFYGDTGDHEITEESEKGRGFLADTVDRWEGAARKVDRQGVRLTLLRTGVVLGRSGGALSRMLPPFRLFLGGPLGSGRQWFPWIHLDDLVEIILFVIQSASMSGALNAVSPNPVTMNEFAAVLGRTIGRPSRARVPPFVLRLLLGEMSDMILGGQKVLPKGLLDAGFHFKYPTLETALLPLVARSGSR